MIPHHVQAVEMADQALQQAESDQVRALGEQIQAAQSRRSTMMTGWLDDWGASTGMPGSDASGMTGTDHSGHDMGGMSVAGKMREEDGGARQGQAAPTSTECG